MLAGDSSVGKWLGLISHVPTLRLRVCSLVWAPVEGTAHSQPNTHAFGSPPVPSLPFPLHPPPPSGKDEENIESLPPWDYIILTSFLSWVIRLIPSGESPASGSASGSLYMIIENDMPRRSRGEVKGSWGCDKRSEVTTDEGPFLTTWRMK